MALTKGGGSSGSGDEWLQIFAVSITSDITSVGNCMH